MITREEASDILTEFYARVQSGRAPVPERSTPRIETVSRGDTERLAICAPPTADKKVIVDV